MRNTTVVMLGSLSKDKTEEYRHLFQSYPQITFKALNEIVWNARHLSDVETGQTYYDNAFIKGRLAHMAAKVPTISDDTGLEVDALGGAPGVRSHRYATAKAGESQDQANVKKLLQELSGRSRAQRKARFVCTLCFFVEGVVLQATETLEGEIIESPRGQHGFGYDCVFVPEGSDKTLAEMTIDEKNKISHRSKALAAIMKQVAEQGLALVRP